MIVRLLTGAADPPGPALHAVGVGSHLAALGHAVEAWVPEDAARLLPADPGVRVVEVAVPSAAADGPAGAARAAARALAERLREAGPADVWHAEDAIAARALIDRRAEGARGAIVRTIHHVDPHDDPELEEMERAAIRHVDARVCVSAAWSERVAEEFGVDSVVVPNGVDVGPFATCPLGRPEAGRLLGWGERPTVLALGGVSRRKGARVLLEAFARARTRLGADALLAVAGPRIPPDDPYRARWDDDAERLGLAVDGTGGASAGAAVSLLGPVMRERMPALFRAADVLAYPSTREGFGVAVLEAAAAGTPAAVSDLPALREHLADDRDCLMVPAGHSGPLAEAIVRLARDAALRARLLRGGRERAARLRWADAAEAHARLYAALAA